MPHSAIRKADIGFAVEYIALDLYSISLDHPTQTKTIVIDVNRIVIDKQKSKFLIDLIQILKPFLMSERSRNESQNICFAFGKFAR